MRFAGRDMPLIRRQDIRGCGWPPSGWAVSTICERMVARRAMAPACLRSLATYPVQFTERSSSAPGQIGPWPRCEGAPAPSLRSDYRGRNVLGRNCQGVAMRDLLCTVTRAGVGRRVQVMRRLSPEAEGVLLALVRLGSIRYIDNKALELADAGLAELSNRGELRINDRGHAAAAELRKRVQRLIEQLTTHRTSSSRPIGSGPRP